MDTEELKEFNRLLNPDLKELIDERTTLAEENDSLYESMLEPSEKLRGIQLEMSELTKRSMELNKKENKTTEELKEESQIFNDSEALSKEQEKYSKIVLDYNDRINSNVDRINEITKICAQIEQEMNNSLAPEKKSIQGNISIGKFINGLPKVTINKNNNEIISTKKKSVNFLKNIFTNKKNKELQVDDELKEKIEKSKFVTIISEIASEVNNAYQEFSRMIDRQKDIDDSLEAVEKYKKEKEENAKLIDETINYVNEETKENTKEAEPSKIEIPIENISNVSLDNIQNENDTQTAEKPEEKNDENLINNVSEILLDQSSDELVDNKQDDQIVQTDDKVEENENSNDSIDMSKVILEENQNNVNEPIDIIKYESNKISVATPQRLKERVIPNFIATGSKKLDYIVKKYNDKVTSVVSKKDYIEAQKLGIDILSPNGDNNYSYKDAYSDKVDALREISNNAKSLEEFRAATDQVNDIFNNNFNKDVVDDVNNALNNQENNQVQNVQNIVNNTNNQQAVNNNDNYGNIFNVPTQEELPKAM